MDQIKTHKIRVIFSILVSVRFQRALTHFIFTIYGLRGLEIFWYYIHIYVCNSNIILEY